MRYVLIAAIFVCVPYPIQGTHTCTVQDNRPDATCTPGSIFPDATSTQICVPGYAKSMRNVSTSTKRKVYTAYGIISRKTGEYSIDHLISLQLGGSNDIANLWPLETETKKSKDRIENYLHKQVCTGKVTLKEAQVKIAGNWREVRQER